MPLPISFVIKTLKHELIMLFICLCLCSLQDKESYFRYLTFESVFTCTLNVPRIPPPVFASIFSERTYIRSRLHRKLYLSELFQKVVLTGTRNKGGKKIIPSHVLFYIQIYTFQTRNILCVLSPTSYVYFNDKQRFRENGFF